jgi:hypothetical protein
MQALNGTWWVPALSIAVAVCAIGVGTVLALYLRRR